MDEQTETGQNQGKEANDSAGADKADEEIPEIRKAREAAEELKRENDRRERLLADEKKLQANRILGGNTPGNIEQTKEETNHDYRLRIQKEIKEGKYD